MMKLHNNLCERFGWYKRYHDSPGYTTTSFVILAVFVTLVGFYMTSYIKSNPILVSLNTSSASSQQGSIGELTSQLLKAVKSYQNASETDKPGILNQIVSIATERKTLMEEKMKNSPKDFLAFAIPKGIANQLPNELDGLIEQEVDASGTFSILYKDDLSQKTGELFYELNSDDSDGTNYDVHFSSAQTNLKTGDKVKMHGFALNQDLAVENLGGSNVQKTSSAVTANISGSQKTIAIVVNFSDNVTQPFSTTDVSNTIFSNPDSTNAYYTENSYNTTTFSGTSAGWYTLSIPQTCDGNAIASAADSAAQAHGVSYTGYTHIVYVFPYVGGCGWAGQSQVGGNPSRTWINGEVTGFVLSHELGHALGMYHANTLYCGGSQISSSCTSTEYGDPYEVMGASRVMRDLAGAHKSEMGWGKVQSVSASGTYTLALQELANSATQILKLNKADTGQSYYVEYRQPVGFDVGLPASMTNGISIHTLGYPSSYNQSQRLDMTPDGDFGNSALADGGVFTDSANGITITQVSHDATSATVQVSMTGAPCVAQVPTISVSPGSATGKAGQALTYSVSVRNNDSSNCSGSTLNLTASLPSGFSSNFSSGSISVNPGSTGSSQITVTSPAGTPDGSYTFSVTASDSTHNVSANASYMAFTPAPDTTPPIVSITSPANGSKVTAANATISATATDNVKVTKVEFRIDGTLVATDTATPYTYKWNTKKVSNGSHTISAKAYDAAGNNTTATITVSI